MQHTEKKRYFTWDKVNFPKPEEFIDKLNEKNRKLVTIIDPHIMADPEYMVAKVLIENGI